MVGVRCCGGAGGLMVVIWAGVHGVLVVDVCCEGDGE